MSNELLERARALADAATPGPWFYGPEAGYVAIAYQTDGNWYDLLAGEHAIIDGKFISQSRELVPALCAALEAAEATIHELRAELAAAEYLLSEGEAHNPEDFQP